MSVLAAALGGAIGWIIGSRVVPVDQTVPYATIAVAVSAVVGAIIVWMPRGTPGSGYRPGARLLTLLCGAMAVAVIYALIRALIPYTKQNPGVMAAWALLIVVVVSAFTRLRRYGLPLILGGIVMTVTISVSGVGDTGLGTLMQIAMIPALIAGLVALLVHRFMTLVRGDSSPTKRSPDDPGEPPDDSSEPDSPQLTGVGS
jgi:hypothetical protein